MSQKEGDSLMIQPNQYAASTESETSADDLSETSDTAHTGATSILTGRKRRRRTIIAADQLMRMEQLYKLVQWPGREKKEELARDIGMSSHFVNIWFQNKRSRMKKLAQEEEELAILRKSRSPGTANFKIDSVQSPSVCPKPVAIAPKPPGNQTVSSLASSSMSPISAVKIPKFGNIPIGQCLVVGQNISINTGAATVSSCLPSAPTPLQSSPTLKMLRVADTSTGKNCPRIEVVTSRKPPTSLQPRLCQANPQSIPSCNSHQTQSPSQQTSRQLNFFKCLVSMMAMEEGGLLKKGDPVFDIAVNAALYGLRIANGNILTYKKKEGLFIHNDRH